MTILSDDLVTGLFDRLEDSGWTFVQMPLSSMVFGVKGFVKDDAQLAFIPEPSDTVGVRLTAGGDPLFAANGLSAEQVVAVCDVMGIVAADDAWITWYRKRVWEGTLAPS